MFDDFFFCDWFWLLKVFVGHLLGKYLLQFTDWTFHWLYRFCKCYIEAVTTSYTTCISELSRKKAFAGWHLIKKWCVKKKTPKSLGIFSSQKMLGFFPSKAQKFRFQPGVPPMIFTEPPPLRHYCQGVVRWWQSQGQLGLMVSMSIRLKR